MHKIYGINNTLDASIFITMSLIGYLVVQGLYQVYIELTTRAHSKAALNINTYTLGFNRLYEGGTNAS